jgi:hypothetical protein
MNILYNTLKSRGTKDNFRHVKVPVTASYWEAWYVPVHVYGYIKIEAD